MSQHRLGKRQATILGILLLLPALAFAHKEHHGDATKPITPSSAAGLGNALAKVAFDYHSKIKPIFLKSCFDCHSQSTRYPWYHVLPFAKGLIDEDVREAKEHLDLTAGFPFKGHGTPVTDLKAIRDAIKDSSMPPGRYVLLHWNSKLSNEEKLSVLEWVDRSLAALGEQPADSSR